MIKKKLVIKKITKPYVINFVIGSQIPNIFPFHFHSTYCIGIIESGERIINYKGSSYTASKGNIFIINQYKPHSCRITSLQHSYKIICLGSELIQLINKEILLKNDTRIPRFKETIIKDKNIFNKIQYLINLAFTNYLNLELESLLNDILSELLLKYSEKSPIEKEIKSDKKIKRSIEYINECYNENISLDILSKLSCLSPFHFNRIFNKSTGLSPHHYLIQTRIKKAQAELLKKKPLIDIALDLGFYDQSHFINTFKKHVGITPGEYIGYNR